MAKDRDEAVENMAKVLDSMVKSGYIVKYSLSVEYIENSKNTIINAFRGDKEFMYDNIDVMLDKINEDKQNRKENNNNN